MKKTNINSKKKKTKKLEKKGEIDLMIIKSNIIEEDLKMIKIAHKKGNNNICLLEINLMLSIKDLNSSQIIINDQYQDLLKIKKFLNI